MCAPAADQQSIEAVRWAVALIVPAAAGLVGVVVGAWLTSRRERRQRQLAYLEKQLSSFYSPMLGLRNEVRTHGALRIRIMNEASAAWTQVCAESEHLDVLERQRITKERGPEFTRIIEYDNNKLHEDLLPAYRKIMASLPRKLLARRRPDRSTRRLSSSLKSGIVGLRSRFPSKRSSACSTPRKNLRRSTSTLRSSTMPFAASSRPECHNKTAPNP